ncbi:MAG: hypothetical protein JW971_03590 [Synergistales bacterium]|nr:hypothetical protein [Synergistales bacterium]
MEKEKEQIFNGFGEEDLVKGKNQKLSQKIATLGWGVFFIWLGIFLWIHFQTGFFLLGLGILILGMQFARRRFDLAMEHFWVAVGILSIVGGFWDLIETELPLVPVLLILAGSGLVLFSFWGKKGSPGR